MFFGLLSLGSDVGWREFQEEGMSFWWDRARAAEVCWLVAYALLLLRLVLFAMLTGKSKHELAGRGRVLAEFSHQTLGTYTFIHIAKAVCPNTWRFHEAGFLDAYSMLLAVSASVLFLKLSQQAQHPQPAPAPGAWFWSGRQQHRLGWITRLAILPIMAGLLAVPLSWMRPTELQERDEETGVWDLAADWMQLLDTMAMLPQFVQFRSAGNDEARVSPTLATWLAWIGLARLLALLSGVFNMLEDWEESGVWNHVEAFYTICSAVNLMMVGQFMFYFAKSQWLGCTDVMLPVFVPV